MFVVRVWCSGNFCSTSDYELFGCLVFGIADIREPFLYA